MAPDASSGSRLGELGGLFIGWLELGSHPLAILDHFDFNNVEDVLVAVTVQAELHAFLQLLVIGHNEVERIIVFWHAGLL